MKNDIILSQTKQTQRAHMYLKSGTSPTSELGSLNPIPPYYNRYSSFSSASLNDHTEVWHKLITICKSNKNINFIPEPRDNTFFCVYEESPARCTTFIIKLFASEVDGKRAQPDHAGIMVEFDYRSGDKQIYSSLREDIRTELLGVKRRSSGLRQPPILNLPDGLEDEQGDHKEPTIHNTEIVHHIENFIDMVSGHYETDRRTGIISLACLASNPESLYFRLLCEMFESHIWNAIRNTLVFSSDEEQQRAATYLLAYCCVDAICREVVQTELTENNWFRGYLIKLHEETRGDFAQIISENRLNQLTKLQSQYQWNCHWFML